MLHECPGDAVQEVLGMINGKNASGNENDETIVSFFFQNDHVPKQV